MNKITRRNLITTAAITAVYPGRLSGQIRNPNQRGYMVHRATLSHAAIADLEAQGINLARYQLLAQGIVFSSTAQFREWALSELALLDSLLLPRFAAGPIKLILDHHSFPRMEDWGHMPIHNREWAREFQWIWRYMANRYAGHPAVYAFDLLNEPQCRDEHRELWAELASRTIELIRAEDPNRVVVFQPKRAEPGYFRGLERLPHRRVLYSVHMYQPMSFTHQRAGDNVFYPGFINDRWVDQHYLRRVLQPVKDFADRNDAGIFVGEFSANQRDAPGASAYLYLRDCIELFEEFNWRWTYHAYEEHPQWNATGLSHDLLLRSFARNAR